MVLKLKDGNVLNNPFVFTLDKDFFNLSIVFPNRSIDLIAPVDSFVIVLNIILCYNAYCGDMLLCIVEMH